VDGDMKKDKLNVYIVGLCWYWKRGNKMCNKIHVESKPTSQKGFAWKIIREGMKSYNWNHNYIVSDDGWIRWKKDFIVPYLDAKPLFVKRRIHNIAQYEDGFGLFKYKNQAQSYLMDTEGIWDKCFIKKVEYKLGLVEHQEPIMFDLTIILAKAFRFVEDK